MATLVSPPVHDSAAAPSQMLDVWYICDQTLCNFDCPYCVTKPQRLAANKRMWGTDRGAATYRQVLCWLASLPWQLRLRLQTKGEPFISSEFLDGAAWMTTQTNTSFVELATNGSCTASRLRRFAEVADMKRISLWITFHPSETDATRVLGTARLAIKLGASVVVHMLLFPGSEAAVREMQFLCQADGIRTDLTVGVNHNNAYPGLGRMPITETGLDVRDVLRHPILAEAMLRAYTGPMGMPCSAGHDYIFVQSNGDVYPCNPYSRSPSRRMGTALDPEFRPALRSGRFSSCEHGGSCVCKEDYLHLDVTRQASAASKSLSYCETQPC